MESKHKTHHYAKGQVTPRQEISDYMTTPILSIKSNASALETAQLMSDKNIGCLLVKEKSEFVGIITETDLTRKVIRKGINSDSIKISEIMTTGPIHTLDCHQSVTDANSFMAQKKIRHLPITDGGKIVGMLSVRDLVSFFANPRLR